MVKPKPRRKLVPRNVARNGAHKVVNVVNDRILHDAATSDVPATSMSQVLSVFFQIAKERQLRRTTMLFIEETVRMLDKLPENRAFVSKITMDFVTRTVMMYQTFVEENQLGEDVTKANVYDEWNSTFDALCRVNIIKTSSSVVLLMQSQEFTAEQKAHVQSAIASFFNDSEKFTLAMDWLRLLQLDDIKHNFFEQFVIKSNVYQNNRFLSFLTTPKEELRYVKVLDGICYRDFFGEKAVYPGEDGLRKRKDNLAKIAFRAAQRYDIDLNEAGLSFDRIRVIKDLLYKFYDLKKKDDVDDDLDDLILRAIGSHPRIWQIDFVKSIRRKFPMKAICWGKFFDIKHNELFLPYHQMNNADKYQVEKFLEKMKLRNTQAISVDSTTEVVVFDVTYKLRKVCTPAGLDDFTANWLSKAKSQVIGIDCESGSVATGYDGKVALLQLATKDWLAVIDVVALNNATTNDQWNAFFAALFDPSITRLGYAFYSDYVYLRGSFPGVCDVFRAPENKVYCLLLYIQLLLVNKDACTAVFSSIGPPESISLSDVTQGILGLYLDKSCRCSDWTRRPLTEDQLLYAVKDALVVVLLKDKIEAALKAANLTPKRIETLFEGCTITMPLKAKSTEGVIKILNNFKDISDTVLEASAKNKEQYGADCLLPSAVTLYVDAAFLSLLPYLNQVGLKTLTERKNNRPTKGSFKENSNIYMITTTKRRRDYPFIPSDRVIAVTTCGEVAGLPQIEKVILDTRVFIDPKKDYFKKCEKCASTDLRYFPPAIYELLFVVHGVYFVQSSLKTIQSIDDICEIAKRIKASPEVTIESVEGDKPMILFNVGSIKIKILQQPVLIMPRSDNPSSLCDRPIKSTVSTYLAARAGVEIKICYECAHCFYSMYDCIEREHEFKTTDVYIKTDSPDSGLALGFAGAVKAVYDIFGVPEKVNSSNGISK